MATTEISGFTIDASATGPDHEPEADDDPGTAEEQLARAVITKLRQGFPKAAMAAAVDLVESIAATYGVGGGAYL